MADPISVAGLLLTIGQIIPALRSYATTVKSSREEIRMIVQEIFALKGVLECISSSPRDELPDGITRVDNETYAQMVEMTADTLRSMSGCLGEPEGRLQRAKTALTWPFAKADFDRYFTSLERSKTWFIMVLMNDTSSTTAKIYSEVVSLANSFHSDTETRNKRQISKDMGKIIQWLAPARPEEDHSAFIKLRSPGSGTWFFDEEFYGWLQGSGEKLKRFWWVKGKCMASVTRMKILLDDNVEDRLDQRFLKMAGSGKTILFASAVHVVETHCAPGGSGYGFHYCSLSNAASQQSVNVFGSILAHAMALRPDIMDWIRPMFTKQSFQLIERNTLTIPELLGLLQRTLQLFDQFYILIDALNETPFEEIILKTLLQLLSTAPNLKVLVTSTTDPVIRFKPNQIIQTRSMTATLLNSDILKYVTNRMKTEPAFTTLPEDTKETIKSAIGLNASAMFRWAQLSMDHLATFRTGKAMKAALKEMPSTLSDTYVGMLQRIPLSDREIAKEALTWLCFSIRHLTLSELAEAVVLQESDRTLDIDSRLANPQILFDICQGFVDTENLKLKLAHDSIRTFLTSDFIRQSTVAYFALDAESSHRNITRKAITYLSFDEFTKGRLPAMRELRKRIVAYPLATYASTYWPIHAEFSTLNPRDEQLILSFFQTKREPYGGSFESWVQILLLSTDASTIAQTWPLYYAASFNMVSILKLLLNSDWTVDVNQLGGRYGSPPLFIACWRGNIEAAKLLIEAGADINARDNSTGLTCRELAQRRGFEEVVTLMPKRIKDVRRAPQAPKSETPTTFPM